LTLPAQHDEAVLTPPPLTVINPSGSLLVLDLDERIDAVSAVNPLDPVIPDSACGGGSEASWPGSESVEPRLDPLTSSGGELKLNKRGDAAGLLPGMGVDAGDTAWARSSSWN